MKKILNLLLTLAMSLGMTLTMAGCKEEKITSVELRENVTLSMVDVLEVDNKEANTVFFYFLAGVDNNSDTVYHLSNLVYTLRAKTKDGYRQINPIDQFKTTITNDINPGMSTYIYGYIGVPRTQDRSIGLYVEAQKEFIPFSSTEIRKIDDSKIVNSDQAQFTIYEDQYYSFDVDASDLIYRYEKGVSTIEGLKISYTNKTDHRLVVPYLSPICTIDGFNLSEFSNADELRNMSQEEIEAVDFSKNGMQAKTESIRAESLGYELFYLGPEQSVTASILFQAEDSIPDFSAKMKNGITININSPALGYRQILKVPY